MNNKIIQKNYKNNNNKDNLKNTNIDVMKCSSLVFRFDNKSKNIGFIIFCILISIFLILIIVHIFKGINSVSIFIYEEMKKYKYINDTDRKFFEKNKIIKVNNNNNRRLSRKRFSVIDSSSTLNKFPRRKTHVFNVNIGGNLINTSTKEIKLNNPNQSKNNNKSNPIKKIKINKKKKVILKRNNEETIQNEENVTEENNNTEKIDNFGIIKINLEKEGETYYPDESNKTLYNNTLSNVSKFENRYFFQILYIFLLSKQIVFHTIFEKSPLIPFQIYLSIFIFTLSFDLYKCFILYK